VITAEVVLRGLLHLLEDHRRDLGRRVPLALDVDRGHVVPAGAHLVGDALGLFRHLADPAPHEPLDRENRVLRVGHRLALGYLAHQPLAVLGERNDGGGRPATLGVGNDDRVAALHDGHDRVGRPEVDPDDLLRHVHGS